LIFSAVFLYLCALAIGTMECVCHVYFAKHAVLPDCQTLMTVYFYTLPPAKLLDVDILLVSTKKEE
jgi:hypothetical protein